MIEFKVEGMSCNHCVLAVTQAVRDTDPQAKVQVDLAAHQVRIDSAAEPRRFAEALAEAGYPTT